ncbi:MAG: toxin glutamine deamidase domain-containing protein [Armatimonadota bacterium]|nr:toxin glutamine deamidase domain-containing protein [Armatimonadota bacterium]MDR7422518.1 toxin glutamine deamidase domain-containing protein [Armatimonadota bacterium]MDR7455368.1 toxin glutamine deamidase domain-containing protein [Armatimonadota bacterium]MDR7457158.1 toxin glutamine deamidase domain-containing protein [Armatimonadota bacterium]MDR7496550.1 toxin glutamine deamidase domain-containing protein [Armatimonadota bacterium]
MRRAVWGPLAAALVLLLASPAYADDCGSLSDCAGMIGLAIAIAAALAAAILLGWLMLPWLAEALAVRTAAAAAARVAAGSAARTGASGAARAAAAGRGRALWDAVHRGAFNPSRSCTNCRQIAENVARFFRGEPFRPAPPSGPGWLTHLQRTFGSEFTRQRSFLDIERFLLAEGHGAQGIVSVETSAYGHVFNAVNINGRVWFLDGQAAVASEGGGAVASMSGYLPEVIQVIRFMFIP